METFELKVNWQVKKLKFYKPILDRTNKVKFMRYCNNGLSYAILESGNFALCESPILSAEINKIIFVSSDIDEIRNKFFELKF